MHLGNLGICQLQRYERVCKQVDIEDSITNLQIAVQLTDDSHPDRVVHLSNLEISQQKHFEYIGKLGL